MNEYMIHFSRWLTLRQQQCHCVRIKAGTLEAAEAMKATMKLPAEDQEWDNSDFQEVEAVSEITIEVVEVRESKPPLTQDELIEMLKASGIGRPVEE